MNHQVHEVFRALGDSNRLKIVNGLLLECQNVNEISEGIGLSQPLTSHHLKILRGVGIVRMEIQATFRYY
ncbi:MAG: metalloregulator ArsR/SmtB family transcription factor [Acidibacillus sp.]|nr:metalloregulator ArsR/SmtB family transcription factor [Acidibacillus sp.]